MMWDTIAEEQSGDISMEYTNCQMQHDLDTVADATANTNAAASNHLRRRQHHHHHLSSIMNSSSLLHDMAVDQPLSFYDDESELAQQQQQQLCYGSPTQQMRLLSPEGSPCRLQILDQSQTNSPKYQQQDFYNNTNKQLYHQQILTTRLQKLQRNNHASSTNSASPAKSLRIYHSLSTGSMGSSSMEDDYMDLLEMETMNNNSTRSPATHAAMSKVPSDLDSLFMGQIKSLLSPPAQQQQKCSIENQSPLLAELEQLRTPEMRRPPVRRCLSMTENCLPTQKTPETLLKQVQELATSPFGTKMLTTERNMSALSYCFKRPEPPSKTNSPVQVKRHRIAEDKENLDCSMTTMSLAALPTLQQSTKSIHHHPPPLRKSMSMNDAEIMSALARSDSTDEPDLIGDFSKPFVLPLMDGRHRDLKSISCDTMARLVRGEFNDVVSNYRIIDCRYPYEFDGGHIRGAENFYTHEQIIAEFLTAQQKKTESGALDKRRSIIIFHCEFSSERGPKLSRFLRSTDRERNTNCYPTLEYPEIYLLHNGYKEFYEQHSELCDPMAYRPMLEPSYNMEYRHFRSKSKSWNGDGAGLGGATGRLKKSRSRLML